MNEKKYASDKSLDHLIKQIQENYVKKERLKNYINEIDSDTEPISQEIGGHWVSDY